jgi:hypothetical protein
MHPIFKKLITTCVTTAMLAVGAGRLHAGIVYNVVGDGPFSGTITTDGTLGAITLSNLVSVDITGTTTSGLLTLTDLSASSISGTNVITVMTSQNTGYLFTYITATSTELLLPVGNAIDLHSSSVFPSLGVSWGNGNSVVTISTFAVVVNSGHGASGSTGGTTSLPSLGQPYVFANDGVSSSPSSPAATPEPTSMILMGMGVGGFMIRRWRRRKHAEIQSA